MMLLGLAGCAASLPAQPMTPPQTSEPTRLATAPPTLASTTIAAEAPPTPAIPDPTQPPNPTAVPAPTPPASDPMFGYPIGAAGRTPGDAFFIRHGYTTENTWYNPGYWHTGEDWYAIDGDAAGAQVYAIARGEVVYAGANYPGRVVIVRHAGELFSMYGHLDPALNVQAGQQLARGDMIGAVLRRADDVPNHLHFELRSFLTSGPVNGDAPRYPFRCGPNCPPGPGYWPIDAPDLPDALGWLNPTHAIGRRMLPPGAAGQALVPTSPISPSLTLWSAPPGQGAPQPSGTLELRPGARYRLLEIYAGPDQPSGASALAYQLWYRIKLPGGESGWAQAAVPTPFERGGDGRPSSVRFNLLPTNAGT